MSSTSAWFAKTWHFSVCSTCRMQWSDWWTCFLRKLRFSAWHITGPQVSVKVRPVRDLRWHVSFDLRNWRRRGVTFSQNAQFFVFSVSMLDDSHTIVRHIERCWVIPKSPGLYFVWRWREKWVGSCTTRVQKFHPLWSAVCSSKTRCFVAKRFQGHLARRTFVVHWPEQTRVFGFFCSACVNTTTVVWIITIPFGDHEGVSTH